MRVLETPRLVLRQVSADDAAFMLKVLNDPAFIRNIGDRGVRNLDDARHYIRDRMVSSYEQHGFGMYAVVTKADSQNTGICGLVRRPGLDAVDIGFAFLPGFCGQGYAREAAKGVMRYAENDLGIVRLAAITSLENHRSIHLLNKLGFAYVKTMALPGSDDRVRLFSWPAPDKRC